MDITIPVTVQEPSTSTPDPFGGQHVIPGATSSPTVTLHIDAPTQAALAALLGIQGTVSVTPTKLTPTELANQYSATDLLSALTFKETPAPVAPTTT